jgi:hypothetical protein
MSVFDTAMACTRNMNECLLQNHFETPPYGPIPDAEGKLRLAVNGMIDALVIAMDAESRGVVMPPVAVPAIGQTQAQTMEHDLHREYAVSLANMPPPAPPEPEARQNTILP